MYNDRSILENMHVSCAFRLMKENKELDILDGFHIDTIREMRLSIINNVLGTDMSSHFEDITLFQAQVNFFFFFFLNIFNFLLYFSNFF